MRSEWARSNGRRRYRKLNSFSILTPSPSVAPFSRVLLSKMCMSSSIFDHSISFLTLLPRSRVDNFLFRVFSAFFLLALLYRQSLSLPTLYAAIRNESLFILRLKISLNSDEINSTLRAHTIERTTSQFEGRMISSHFSFLCSDKVLELSFLCRHHQRVSQWHADN